MNNEMKNMAARLGIGFPEDATEHEQLAAIANQVGMPDYYYNASDNQKLYNTLSDMCGENGIPSDIAGTDYDPATEPDYMSDEYQRQLHKDDELGDEEQGDGEGEEGKPEGEEKGPDGESQPDSGDDTQDPNAQHPEQDPNNPNQVPNQNPNQVPGDPNHPGQEGPGYNQQNPNDPNGNPNGNGVVPPNQTQDQRDAGTHDPGEPGSNGYGDVNPSQGGSDSSQSTALSRTNQSNSVTNTQQTQGDTPHRDISDSGSQYGQRPGADAQKPNAGQNPSGRPGSSPKSGGKGSQGDNESGGGPAPAGNGYGALRNKNRNGSSGNGGDPTGNARRNMDHNNKSKSGGGAGAGGAGGAGGKFKSRNSADSGMGSKGGFFSGLGSKVKNGIANRLGRKQDRDIGDDGEGGGAAKKAASKIGEGLKHAIWTFLKTHPFVLLVLILLGFILLIIFFMLLLGGDSSNSHNSNVSKSCNYSLNGVISTGTVDLTNVQVELVNCDAKKDNYTVLETIDFEKYVVGVALAEVSWHKDYPAYFQAQIVAARGFALKRNSAMCPSHPDDCFYGYNPNTGNIRLRACTNDQVYCDYDKTCMKYPRSGKPTLYGPEAEKMSGATVWKNQLSETTKAEILAAAEEVKGKVLVDSEGNVVYTNFVNTDQKQWWEYAKQGMNYEEILVKHYSSSGASGMSSAECSYGNIDYGDYTLSSDGKEILHEPLDQFLQKKGTSLEAFNKLIESNVEKNGYGTRAGVVAAAVTLIGELGDKYGVKVPYFWGGGHGDGVVVGALAKWGSTQCHTYANGQSYNYCGLDCSGFVPWAIKNGGFNRAQGLASSFYKSSGAKKVTLNPNSAVVQPGDLLESSHHVILVVGIDESSKEYICAEAMGNAYGVTFSRRSFAPSGYWGVDLTDYYNNQSNVRSK